MSETFSGICIGGPADKKGHVTTRNVLVVPELIEPHVGPCPSKDLDRIAVRNFHYHFMHFIVDGERLGFWIPMDVRMEQGGMYVMKALVGAYRK